MLLLPVGCKNIEQSQGNSSFDGEQSSEVNNTEDVDRKCGDNLTWSLVDTVLTISGTGEMYDYYSDSGSASVNSPWNSYINIINSIIIGDSVTSIGNSAFVGCSSIFTINGSAGSEAEKYANDNGVAFVALWRE